jgi:hypothetical protein
MGISEEHGRQACSSNKREIISITTPDLAGRVLRSAYKAKSGGVPVMKKSTWI